MARLIESQRSSASTGLKVRPYESVFATVKPTPRMVLVALLAIGLMGALLHLRKPADPEPDSEYAGRAIATPSSPVDSGLDVRVPPDENPIELPGAGTGSVTLNASEQQASTQRPSTTDMAASYADTMQTGVFGEESMPEFAQVYLFPTEGARQAADSSHNEFFDSTMAGIGALQAEVRGAHLEAHLAQVDILTPEQNALYAKLRGYGESAAHPGSHSHHGH